MTRIIERMKRFRINYIKLRLNDCKIALDDNKLFKLQSMEEVISLLKSDEIFQSCYNKIVYNTIMDIMVHEFGVLPEEIHKNSNLEILFPIESRREMISLIEKKTGLVFAVLTMSVRVFILTGIMFVVCLYFLFIFFLNNPIFPIVMPGLLKFGIIFIIASFPSITIYFLYPNIFAVNRFTGEKVFEELVKSVTDYNKNKSEQIVANYLGYNSTASPIVSTKSK